MAAPTKIGSDDFFGDAGFHEKIRGALPLQTTTATQSGKVRRQFNVFQFAEENFSKRASSAFRIWRSTTIEMRIPPAQASGSIREAIFTPSP